MFRRIAESALFSQHLGEIHQILSRYLLRIVFVIVHNFIFTICFLAFFTISIWHCSTSYLTLFSIWLSHGSEFKSLMNFLRFSLWFCHFIIARRLQLPFSKFVNSSETATLSAIICLPKKLYCVMFLVYQIANM